MEPVSCTDESTRNPLTADYAPPIAETYRARQAEYLDFCFEGSGPEKGGLYGQICRIARGGESNPDPIKQAHEKVTSRKDTSDFTVAALLRMLYLDRRTHAMDADTRSLIEQTVLEFKYWLDEPGQDKMAYWTENHQILFHSNEMLAGLLFPDSVFPNAGMTGKEHVEHALPLTERWLNFRARFGFSEWHSNVYFNEDIPALVNLVDFAEDDEIRVKAAMVLDLIAFDLLNNTYKGFFATTHGRTYPDKLLDGLKDSTREAAWIMLGLGSFASPDNFSASFLATSEHYWTPGLLEAAAEASMDRHEHRQRDSIDVADGPNWGIGYEDVNDVVFWAGLAALVAPRVVNGTVKMMDDFNLWDGFLFGDLPEDIRGLMRSLAASGQLEDLASQVELLSRGIALESVNTYTYRTPHYQLSGAQSYKPGFWGAQTHIWQATLDGEAYVFTTYPSEVAGVSLEQTFAGDWIGSWFPRATFHRNVGIIQYRKPEASAVDQFLKSDHTHAFFPRDRFDEVVQAEGWTIGRKGDGYLALYSQTPTLWAEGNRYELDATALDNVWIVELGSREENGSFDAFVSRILAARVEIADAVLYESPSSGIVHVGWTGPMTVEGTPVDLGPYNRWDNSFAQQIFGELKTTIEFGGNSLVLDFEKGERRLVGGVK